MLVFCDALVIFDQSEDVLQNQKNVYSERISADSDLPGELFSKRVPLLSVSLKAIANVKFDQKSKVVGSFFSRRRRKWSSRSEAAAGLDFSSIPVSYSIYK